MKKRWKFWIALVIGVVLAAQLAACGQSSAQKEEPKTEEAASVEEAAEEEAAPEAEEETEEPAAESEAEPEEEASSAEEAAEEAAEPEAVAESDIEEAAEAAKEAEEEVAEGRYFKLTYMKDGETEYTSDILAAIGAGHLLLRDDGTGEIAFIGNDPEEIEWTDTEIIAEGEPVSYTLTDGVLRIEEGETAMEFTEGDPEETTAPLAPADYDPNSMVGYYKISTVEDEGEVTDASVLELIGMQLFLVLNEDGTGYMDMFDAVINVTWSEDSLAIEGAPIDFEYDAGTLTMDFEGSKMTFVYAGTPDEAPEIETEG